MSDDDFSKPEGCSECGEVHQIMYAYCNCTGSPTPFTPVLDVSKKPWRVIGTNCGYCDDRMQVICHDCHKRKTDVETSQCEN